MSYLDKFSQCLRDIKRATPYGQIKKQLFFHSRQGSAGSRLLPSFIIIGAQKSGTTSLFKYLRKHPDIQEPSRKELFFFDGGKIAGRDIFHEQGLDWYRLHFPRAIAGRPSALTYEATTSYLFSPIAAERIQQTLPSVRLIAVLRDPVDRTISHYQHNLRKGREFRSLMEVICADETQLDTPSPTQPASTEAKTSLYYSYKSRGLYYEQLLRYKYFLDRGQILILCSKELASQPAATLQKIYKFLSLSDRNVIISSNPYFHNVSRQKTQIDPVHHEILQQYFESPNRQLFELLDREFAWQRPASTRPV